jgi:hypothetical protein
MQINPIPLGTTDRSTIPRAEHPGEKGRACWQARHCGSVRVRMVEYTPGYVADHAEPHRSLTPTGAKLFIVD